MRAFKIRAKSHLSSLALKDIIWYDSLFISSSSAFWHHSCVHGFHHAALFHLSRECQAICSWISRTFEDNSKSQVLMPRWAAQIRMETSNTQVSLNATHFAGGSNNANQWRFWGISLITYDIYSYALFGLVSHNDPWYSNWETLISKLTLEQMWSRFFSNYSIVSVSG